MRTLTIVSPAYRESATLPDFHAELARAVAPLEARYAVDFLFVVDPGGDDTVAVLERIAAEDPRVRVIVMSARFGHQAALVAGLDHCDADAVVMLDSDLQHPPSLVPELVARFEDGFDVVNTVRQDARGSSWAGRVASRWFYRLLGLLSDTRVPTGSADFRLLSRRVVRVFQLQLRERNQFLRGLVAWVGFPTTVVRYTAGARRAGASKYSFRRRLGFGIDGVVSFSKRPLVASIAAGTVVGVFAVAYAVYGLAVWLTSASLPDGWTSTVLLLSLFSAVQLVFLGVLGLYLGAVFDEVKARPHYVVERTINVSPAVRPPAPPPGDGGTPPAPARPATPSPEDAA